MSDYSDKQLPYSLISEQSLIGSILVDPNSIDNIADIVGADDFYSEEHKQIFRAMKDMFINNRQIDVVTLIDTLVRLGIYDKSGGENYISSLLSIVPSARNIRDYAKIVRDKSVLRSLIAACSDVSDAAFSEQDDVSAIIDNAQNRIYSIAQGREVTSFKHINEVIQTFYAQMSELQNGTAAKNISTGYSGLDKVLVGMGKTDLVLIGARPGMGKTSFALNIATNVAASTKQAVAIFSLEMSAEQLVSRIIASEALVSSYSLRSGNLTSDEWAKIAGVASRLSTLDMMFDDSTNVSISSMKAKLRKVHNLGLVVIDYLQLMTSDRRTDNRAQEVAEITRAMKIMAKELNVPVICCTQLNRGTEGRTDKKPQLSDMRDSGSIEQDADIVMMIYRSEYYNTGRKAEDDSATNVEIIVAKNRHGSTGSIEMSWIGKYTKFLTVTDESGRDKI